MQITLNDELAQKLTARVNNSEEFHTVDKYVEYILGQVLAQAEEESSDYDQQKEEAVKKRLEDLGYLD